ncbi:DUF983 domain-containing protein, partial [Hansschlegelia beijingensis]|uniref:DUF983 domain-containing protein n=1 Tax=Hansschlegelia beijingensis TaxID=1133344 RepID=UPI00387F1438
MDDGRAVMSSGASALAGAVGRCPACGRGRLFDGYIKLRPSCAACGLDFGFADSGDGPAVFVMLVAGFAALGFVLWAELALALWSARGARRIPPFVAVGDPGVFASRAALLGIDLPLA